MSFFLFSLLPPVTFDLAYFVSGAFGSTVNAEMG